MDHCHSHGMWVLSRSSRRRCRVAEGRAVLLGPLVSLAVLVSPAAAFQLGIEDDGVLLHRYHGDPDTVLYQGKQLGASVVRMVIGPVGLKPGEYDWTATDAAVDAARAHGYRVCPTLGGPAKPQVRRSVRFAAAAAAHFRGRVDDFAVYNEPDYMHVDP